MFLFATNCEIAINVARKRRFAGICHKLWKEKIKFESYLATYRFFPSDMGPHMDLCGTLCTPGQVLEDSSLLGHKNIILLISSTEHQMLIWDSLLIKIYNPNIFLTLILDALQDSFKVTMYKIHCCNYYMKFIACYKSHFAQKASKKQCKINLKLQFGFWPPFDHFWAVKTARLKPGV